MAKAYVDRADVELLVQIAETGSLTKAAKALGIHHATAFRRLADLEQHAGAAMFERLPQSYVPTVAGEKVLIAARRLRSELWEFDAQFRDLNAMGAPLRVTTSDGLAYAFLPELMRAFSDAHPHILVDLVVENRVLSVPEREVDIALRPAREVSGDMVCRRVAAIAYSLYASRDYIRRHGSLNLHAPNFSGHKICGYSATVAYFTTAKWLQRHAKAAQVVAECNSLTAMQAMARTGMSIAALPCVLANSDSQLVALLPPVAAMETSLWVCTHKRLRKNARVRTFLDFFYDAIEKNKSQLAGTTEGGSSSSAREPRPR